MKLDAMTLKTSNSLNEFMSFFEDGLLKKVLEIDDNAISNNYYRELIRISNSLEQYTKKQIGLFYVGFLGSYSSGKSSTINSLLNLWEMDHKREVSNNPTDTNITLLTNQSNVNNIFSFSKEGAISIRTDTNFNLQFLENIVLMDTPGSGDPRIIESIVRDSLPLCDLIIYTLNATTPFTEIDKPFLIAQQSKLNNIPIILVLTRGDEYKLHDGLLSNDNFAEEKYLKDLSIIIERINEAIKISTFKTEDFIIIDNKENFNIDLLRERILSYSIRDFDNLIGLHYHKIEYFKNEIQNIQTFYMNLAKSKIEKCKKFINKANENIDYFDHQIGISKLKFKSLWSEYNQKISRINDGILGGYTKGIYNELDELNTIKSSDFFIFLRKMNRVKLEENSASVAKLLIKLMEDQAYREINNLRQKIVESINYKDYTIEDKFEVDGNFSSIYKFPLSLSQVESGLLLNSKNLLYENYKIVIDIIKRIAKTIQLKKPLDSINENIISYLDSSKEILNLYFDAVKMYNVVVFSYEVKTYITELGLASKFDKLDGDINKSKYLMLTEGELEGNYSHYTKIFESDMDKLFSEVSETFEKYVGLEVMFDNSKLDFMKNELNETFEEVPFSSSELNYFLNGAYKILLSSITNSLYSFKSEIKKLKRKRIKKYVFWSSAPVIAFLLTWMMFNLSGYQTPPSLSSTILLGTGCSIIATGITKFFDRFRLMFNFKVEGFIEELKVSNELIVNKIFDDFKKENIKREKSIYDIVLESWIKKEELLINQVLENKIFELEGIINNSRIEIKEIVSLYEKAFKSLYTNILKLFDNPDDLSSKIDSIASQIKEESIKPSFDLLNQTMSEIKLVLIKIEKLQY